MHSKSENTDLLLQMIQKEKLKLNKRWLLQHRRWFRRAVSRLMSFVKETSRVALIFI